MLKNSMFVLCFILFSSLNAVKQEPAHDGMAYMQWCYEQLRTFCYRNETESEDILQAISFYKTEYPDAFELQDWHLLDDHAIKLSILDIGLISLRCQEEILNLFVTHGQDLSTLKQEFEEYEREKMLVDMLRKAGMEQQLMQAEIVHYAQVMLNAWVMTVGGNS